MHASRPRTAHAASRPKSHADLEAECEKWCGQFERASAAVQRLIDKTDPPAAGEGTQSRKHHELLELLQLVADRLGTASTQVQHTRGQAAMLSQLQSKLVSVEKERDGQKRIAEAACAAERRAQAELAVLCPELQREELARRDTREADAANASDASLRRQLADLRDEVARLRRTAEQEMCERFSATRELEGAKRQLETMRGGVHIGPKALATTNESVSPFAVASFQTPQPQPKPKPRRRPNTAANRNSEVLDWAAGRDQFLDSRETTPTPAAVSPSQRGERQRSIDQNGEQTETAMQDAICREHGKDAVKRSAAPSRMLYVSAPAAGWGPSMVAASHATLDSGTDGSAGVRRPHLSYLQQQQQQRTSCLARQCHDTSTAPAPTASASLGSCLGACGEGYSRGTSASCRQADPCRGATSIRSSDEPPARLASGLASGAARRPATAAARPTVSSSLPAGGAGVRTASNADYGRTPPRQGLAPRSAAELERRLEDKLRGFQPSMPPSFQRPTGYHPGYLTRSMLGARSGGT